MKSRHPKFACIAAMTSVAALCLLSACNDKIDENTDLDNFRISPSDITLSASDAAAVLTVIGGQPPYQWSVADGSLGSVTGDSEVVTYSRTTKTGANTVQVRDNREWIASVVVSQTDQEQADIAVSPTSSTLTDDGDSLVLIATGTEPFTWQLADRDRGRLNTSSGRSTIYTRKSAGGNTVILYDGKGNVATATITQPAATPETIQALSITANPTTLSADGDMSTITVTGGVPPYNSLNIGNAVIGEFVSVSPSKTGAAYRRTGSGVNLITVIDNNGAYANVLIQQPANPPSDLAVTAVPPSLNADGDLSLITVTGGTPPYNFTVLNLDFGGFYTPPGVSDTTAVYKRMNVGDNVVKVVDANDETTYLIISQP